MPIAGRAVDRYHPPPDLGEILMSSAPVAPASGPEKGGKKTSLWGSALIFSAMTMLSRIAGMVRDMVFLNLFGADKLMDAFLVAFKIPNFMRRLFAEGAFAQAFVPVLSEYKTTRQESDVKALVDRVAGSLAMVLGSISILAMAASPVIIFLFAPGFRGDEVKFTLASDMLRITFPYLLLISLTALAGGILNTYGRFGASAFTPVLMNLVLIATAVWLAPLMDVPIMALAWGVLIAGVVQLAFQVPFLHQIRMLPRFRLGFQDEGVKRVLTLMVPALFGVSVSQINLLLDTILASFLVEGSVSWMYTAERLTELPLGLIGIAVGTVILPSLSAKHAEARHEEFTATIDWALRVIVLVGVPASLAMGILAEPLIATIFHHGKFDVHDTLMSAAALQALSGGILAFMMIKVFAPGYFSRQDTRTPVRIGIIAMVANMVFNLMLVWHLKHVGLALASTLSAFLNAGLLYAGLHKRGIYRLGVHWIPLGLKYAGANLALVGVLVYLRPGASVWFEGDWHLRVAWLTGLCVAGVLAYFITLFALGFRLREIRH